MDGLRILEKEFRSLVLPNAPLETLGTGYRWLEGPVWFADHDTLLVSDLPNDRILRWTENAGVSVFRSPSGFANGHTPGPTGCASPPTKRASTSQKAAASSTQIPCSTSASST